MENFGRLLLSFYLKEKEDTTAPSTSFVSADVSIGGKQTTAAKAEEKQQKR